MRPAPRISVVVPLYNEEGNVPALLSSIGSALEQCEGSGHEIVLVDDGSRDGTRAALTAAASQDARIVAICLSRNFGHQAALTAGLDHARGDVVVVMDGDLQDDPGMIPKFVALYRGGFDVVYAQRRHRKEAWWLRTCYAAFYRVLARIAEVPLPVDAGDFGLIGRVVLDAMKAAPEHNRYLRGLRAWAGFRQVGVQVDRRGRLTGRSKYGLWGLTRLALTGLFAFSIAPIRAAAAMGFAAVALSSVFGLYALYAKLFLDRSPRGFTATILVTIFLSGVNLLFLGIIGEYVGRVYEEVKRRPVYVVEALVRAVASPSGTARALSSVDNPQV